MKQKIVALVACVSLILPIAWLQAHETTKTDKKKTRCIVCYIDEGEEIEEVPVATVKYKGKSYGFCRMDCKASFEKNPEAYMPPVFPRPLPAFTVKTLNGKEVPSKALTGKPMLIDFWATWSKPAVGLMPDLQKLHQRHAPKGFSVVAISVEDGAQASQATRQFITQRQIKFPVYLGATKTPPGKVLQLRLLPAMYLVDAKGQIVQQWTTGKVNFKEVDQAVAKLVSSAK